MVWLSPATLVEADETHLSDTIPGGRAAMMGGAYVALSDDPSGAYHNPAGLSFVQRGEFSANATAFYDQHLRYRKALAGQDFVTNADSTYPSLIGAVYNLGRLKIAYSIVTLDNRNTRQSNYFEDIDGQQNFAQNYSRFHHSSTDLQLYGTSAALNLGPIGLGVSGYFYDYESEQSIHQMVEFSGDRFLNLDQSVTSTSTGMMVIAGLMLRLDSVSFGLAIRQVTEFSDDATITADRVTHEPNATAVAQHSEAALETQDIMIPGTTALGFAWHPSKSSFVLSFAAVASEAMEHDFDDEASLRQVVNLHLGLEVALGSSLTWRAGTFSNLDLNKTVDVTGGNQPDQVNYIGSTTGIVFESSEFASSLGYVGQHGTGKAQIVAGIPDVQDVVASSNAYIISLSYFSK